MKKIKIVLLFFVIGIGTISAQKGFNYQIALQPGLSFLSGDWIVTEFGMTSTDVLKKSFTFGFEGGVNCGYKFNNFLGASMGLFYSMQGQHYKDTKISGVYGTETLKHDINLSYLKIPFKCNGILKINESLSFTGFAGFYLGILTGYKETFADIYPDGNNGTIESTVEMKGKTITIKYNTDAEKYSLTEKPFKSTDFGMTLGAGIQKKISESMNFNIILNYQIGFVDVINVYSKYFDDEGQHYVYNSYNSTEKHRNSTLGIMIGITKSL
jgi:hypothetical protein